MYHVSMDFNVNGWFNERSENDIGRMEMRFRKEKRIWKLPGPMYANDLVLCNESEEDLRAVICCFIEICKRKGLQVMQIKAR